MTFVDKELLRQIADLHQTPKGAYNIRKNGEGIEKQSTANIEIITKTDKPGINIIVKPGTKNESVHIPVIVTESGINDLVYNTFEIGADADVLIVAGCGIHNDGSKKSQHDGIHHFIVGPRARVRYVEKHYGEGEGTGERVLNPQTIIDMAENSWAEMDLIQLRGVDSTKRDTKATLANGAHLVLLEKMLTHDKQVAESSMEINLNGEDAKVQVISRSVAQDDSKQIFYPQVMGNSKCWGHVQCDAIIMGQASVKAIPGITANNADAQLIHEAAIGRIAGDQIIKMMTLGLNETEAEERILQGFLK